MLNSEMKCSFFFLNSETLWDRVKCFLTIGQGKQCIAAAGKLMSCCNTYKEKSTTTKKNYTMILNKEK